MIDGLSCVTLDLQIGKQTSRSESKKKKKKKVNWKIFMFG